MRRAGRGPRSRRRLTSARIGADAPSGAALSTPGDTVSASNVQREAALETSPSITSTTSSMMLREYPADVLSRTIELVNNPQSTAGYVITLFGAPGCGKRTVIDFIHKKSNRLCCSLSQTFANGVAVIQEEDFEQWILFILGKIILANSTSIFNIGIPMSKTEMENSARVKENLQSRLKDGQTIPLTLYFENIDQMMEQAYGKVTQLFKVLKELIALLNKLGITIVFTGCNKLLLPEIVTHFKTFDASQLVSSVPFSEAYAILQKHIPNESPLKRSNQNLEKVASFIRGPVAICSEFLSQVFQSTSRGSTSHECLTATFSQILKQWYRTHECIDNMKQSFLEEFTITLSHPQNMTCRNENGLVYKISKKTNPQDFNTVFTYGMMLNKTGLIEVSFDGENQSTLIVLDPCPCALSAMCQSIANHPSALSVLHSSCRHRENIFEGEFEKRVALDLAKFWSPLQFYVFEQTGYHCDSNLQFSLAIYHKDAPLNGAILLETHMGTIRCGDPHESFDFIYYGIEDGNNCCSENPDSIMVVCRVTSISNEQKLLESCLHFFRLQKQRNIPGIFAFLSEHRKSDKHPNGCDVFTCFKIISGPDIFSSTREDILSSSEEIPNARNSGATTAPIQSPDTDSFVSRLADLVIALEYGPESRFVASLETLIPSDKELFSLVQPISEANSAMDIYRSLVHHVSDFQIKRIADHVEGLTNG
ncbi:hypothetical protein Pelo_15255 [Pelomyxa schiedti]|nr:hypothetical protein Pelo_15255 [Pelomyxa schiedti]